MKFYIMTLFPEMVMSGLNTSIIGRAMEKGLLEIKVYNIRDYANNKHGKVDDYPYGGGAGMLMQAEPVYLTYLEILKQIKKDEASGDQNALGSQNDEGLSHIEQIIGCKKPRLVYLTPQGSVFTQSVAENFSKEETLILLCGHYEGIDERVLEEIVTDYISIGDYVLTGGELPAMVMVDAISRLVPGVLNNEDSSEFESFQDGLLEYPQYSRPEEWRGKRVPEVLMSGHHANIEKWRHEQSVVRTRERRPDLLEEDDGTKRV